ncbi:MAG TPA: dihydropteroate synthase [Candidatus Omnitrophota bacterium]|nr:dihydropteroate synthase [Candidatus Omnitrophota bacterium]
MIWKARERIASFDRTLLSGIVNVTPDSFSDGGKYLDPAKAVQHALELLADGADMLDLGAESTRPGSKSTSAAEEIKRLLPVLRKIRKQTDGIISIDTTKAEVAKRCLDEGADAINDTSNLRVSGKKMVAAVKSFKAGLILMHSRGTPETMREMTEYQDLSSEVLKEIAGSVEMALKGGVERERIMIDPGLGFAKNTEQNIAILRDLKPFLMTGYPVMVGPSRKSFIGAITGRDACDRDFGTAACVASCAMQGIHVLRIHHVRGMRDVIKVTEAIKTNNQ